MYNDHSETTLFDSVRDNGEDYILTRQAIVDYIELYLRTPADFHDSRFAPLIATSLADLPRTLVITAEYDPLRDEGEAFAARLDAEGNEVACFRMNDGVHGYFFVPLRALARCATPTASSRTSSMAIRSRNPVTGHG